MSVYTTLAQYGLYGVVGLGGIAVGAGAAHYATKRLLEVESLEPIDDLGDAQGFKLSNPGRRETRLQSLIKAYGARRQKRKAVTDGTVRWHLVDSTFSEAMYVNPERKAGGNVAELDHDGSTYVFPERVMVPAEGEGIPTVVHRKGESEPIDLRSQWDLSIKANTLKEYLTLRVTSSKPDEGLGLGIGDWDSMDVLRYGVMAIVVLFLLLQVFG